MPTPQTNWFKIANNIYQLPWQTNNLCVIQANGKQITLAKYNNGIYAVAYKCPHASGIMANGFVDAIGNIVCPLHRYKFSLQNGRNVSGEGYYLKTYAIDVKEDGIYVGFEDTGFFSFL